MKIPVGVVNHQPGFWGHGTTRSTKTKLAGLFTQPLLLLIPNPPCGFQQIQCWYLVSASYSLNNCRYFGQPTMAPPNHGRIFCPAPALDPGADEKRNGRLVCHADTQTGALLAK